MGQRQIKTHFSSFDKSVFLWDVENTTIIRRFRGHAGRVNCVKLHEEGSLAVSGSVDGTARIWDLRSRSYEPIQERIQYVCDAHSKAGCISPMVVISTLPNSEFEPSVRREAPYAF